MHPIGQIINKHTKLQNMIEYTSEMGFISYKCASINHNGVFVEDINNFLCNFFIEYKHFYVKSQLYR